MRHLQYITLFSLFFFQINVIFAQDSISIYKNINRKKYLKFEVYYGGPNLNSSTINFHLFGIFSSIRAELIPIFNIGPIGGRFECMIAEKASVGIDINYLYMKDKLIYSYNQGGFLYTVNDTVTLTRLRIFPRMCYYFTKKDKVEFYFHYGMGVVINKLYYNESTKNEFTPEVSLAMRVGLGARRYINDYLGVFGDCSFLGGATINLGISTRF